MVRLDEALAAVSDALEAALQAAVPRLGAPHVVLGNPAEASAKHGESSQGRFLVTLTGLRVGAGRGAPKFMHLTATGGTLLVAPHGEEIILVAVAERTVNAGLARLEMFRALEMLA
jgi:hypothetical protein